jgi:hypothetical protein
MTKATAEPQDGSAYITSITRSANFPQGEPAFGGGSDGIVAKRSVATSNSTRSHSTTWGAHNHTFEITCAFATPTLALYRQ